MLSISSKCRYGIAAVLALAEYQGQGLLQIKDIAARKDIPRQYLEQIFNRLVNAGVVKSVRGKKGGYRLAQDPKDLQVLTIVEILEGGIHLTEENYSSTDAIHNMFHDIEVELRSMLQVNFSELEARQHKLRANVMYHI